jgi:multidrug efflux pump subunit AcrA (membrane-fusion protein)
LEEIRHMRKRLGVYGLIALTACAVAFIGYAFVKVAAVPEAATPPALEASPAKVYGVVEPAGREVYVSPLATGRVTAILVAEGDTVAAGQTLCRLDNAVESAQLAVALADIESARRTLAISRDDLVRQRSLYADSVTSESAYTQALLKTQLDSVRVVAATRQADLARTRLDQMELRSPIDGIVYKLDIRLGETLEAGQSNRIVLGSAELWVRLYVESFWMTRIRAGTAYKLYDSETGAYLGSGTVLRQSQYLTRRDFRTEETQERFDVGFREVVLSLEPEAKVIPLGLSVLAELPPEAGSPSAPGGE